MSSHAVTVLRVGGGSEPERLIALEETPPPSVSFVVRFLNAVPDVGPLDFGTMTGAGVPNDLVVPIVPPLEFASPAPPEGAVDERGYFMGAFFDWFVGAARSGQTEAVMATRVEGFNATRRALSLYAVASADSVTGVEPLLCFEDAARDGLADCSSGPAASVVVDTLDVVLAGNQTAHYPERSAAVVDALRSSAADVLCLQQVWLDSEKERIAAELVDRFPHSLWFAHDHMTPFTDATDLAGDVPTPPSEAPCAAPAAQAATDDMLSCLVENCSTVPGSETGMVGDPACATSTCSAESLQFGPPEIQACGFCLLFVAAGASIEEMRRVCSTETQPFVFDGQSPLMVLSSLPLTGDVFVSPATLVRKDIIRAELKLSNGVDLDVHCGWSHTVPPFSGAYPGIYGLGAPGPEGWTNELELYQRNLIELVRTMTGDRKGLVVGNFSVGPEVRGPDGQIVLEGFEEQRYRRLVEAFPQSAPPEFQECTFCAENPLTAQMGVTGWSTHVLRHNIPSSSVVGYERVYTEIVTEAADGTPIPVSSNYGIRATFEVRP